MYTETWQNNHKSICSISFISSSNIQVSAITGFKLGNQILTDDTIYNIKDAELVEIKFYESDGTTGYATLRLEYKEFLKLLPEKAEFGNLGIAIIPTDFPELEQVPSMVLCRSCNLKIGSTVAIIGYQAEFRNLSLKTGVISSFYTNSRGLGFIQYDGTVKLGNSGAPLVDGKTGNVLGVVLHKELINSKTYKEMMEIIDGNLKVLKEHEGKIKYFEVDIAQVLYASQSQIKHMAREFFMNATIKAGLALEIAHVVEYMETEMEPDSDAQYSD